MESANQRSFIEIEESDTPFYQFQNDSIVPRILPEYHLPSEFQQEDDMSPTPKVSAASRNSIFDVCHAVMKPATKMNDSELQELKLGKCTLPVLPEKPQITIPTSLENSKYIITPVSALDEESKYVRINVEQLRAMEKMNCTFVASRDNLIGEGRYSQVYLGSITHTDGSQRICAVKKLHNSPDEQYAGFQEAVMLNYLSRCPNIISVIDVRDGLEYESKIAGALDSRIEMVFEYLPNGNLWEWLKRNPNQLSKRIWLRWAMQLAEGCAYIHEHGVIHHDIKPHNLMLNEDLQLRICDFGNAKFVPEVKVIMRKTAVDGEMHSPMKNFFQTQNIVPGTPISPSSQSLKDGLGLGTLAYSAPEIFSGKQSEYSFPSDVYSIGVTLYTLISNVEPFALAASNSRMLFGIKRGFFESGMQESAPADTKAGIVGEPLDFRWRFQSGEHVSAAIVNLVVKSVSPYPGSRPTCSEMAEFFKEKIEQA